MTHSEQPAGWSEHPSSQHLSYFEAEAGDELAKLTPSGEEDPDEIFAATPLDCVPAT